MDFNPHILHVYLVGGTQDAQNDVHVFLEKVELAMASGITAFQYREKGSSNLSTNQRVELGLKLRTLCWQYAIPLIVDDDYELAQQIDADGVHVGQNDSKIKDVSIAVGNQMFIGYSCNTTAEVNKSNAMNFIDYIGSGPVFPTISKADANPAIGLENLAQLKQLSKHPLVAIGGINEQNMEAVHNMGVDGIATISLILNSDDVVSTVKKMKELYK